MFSTCAIQETHADGHRVSSDRPGRLCRKVPELPRCSEWNTAVVISNFGVVACFVLGSMGFPKPTKTNPKFVLSDVSNFGFLS